MKIWRPMVALLGLALVACGGGGLGTEETPAATEAAPGDPPAVGDVAPDFELPGSDGKSYRLADFRGKKAVVVAWFPKAFTGG